MTKREDHLAAVTCGLDRSIFFAEGWIAGLDPVKPGNDGLRVKRK
jgi:hypothetical protein